MRPSSAVPEPRAVRVETGDVSLEGDLTIAPNAKAVVLFAHGSGSSRFSSRNKRVASLLQQCGFATLLMDLLTPNEEERDRHTGEHRFDIARLAERLVAAVEWLGLEQLTARLPVAIFGASTGGGAALVAATEVPESITAVVSRGGRPDLAGSALARVRTPTLLIVGGADLPVLELNRAALAQISAPARLEVIPGATHLFEEPGALDEVARHAGSWIEQYLSNV